MRYIFIKSIKCKKIAKKLFEIAFIKEKSATNRIIVNKSNVNKKELSLQ